MKVLFSGFRPFGRFDSNPSEALMRAIQRGALNDDSSVEIESIVLPVDFDKAFLILKERIDEFRPEAVVAFGLGSDRDRICLERIAINFKASAKEDAKCVEGPVQKDGPDGIFANLPLAQINDALNQNGIPSCISNTAGTYVCNTLMYELGLDAKKNQYRFGFIHLPNPSLSPANANEAQNLKALRFILDSLKPA